MKLLNLKSEWFLKFYVGYFFFSKNPNEVKEGKYSKKKNCLSSNMNLKMVDFAFLSLLTYFVWFNVKYKLKYSQSFVQRPTFGPHIYYCWQVVLSRGMMHHVTLESQTLNNLGQLSLFRSVRYFSFDCLFNQIILRENKCRQGIKSLNL